jgi:hypothetical protein
MEWDEKIPYQVSFILDHNVFPFRPELLKSFGHSHHSKIYLAERNVRYQQITIEFSEISNKRGRW